MYRAIGKYGKEFNVQISENLRFENQNKEIKKLEHQLLSYRRPTGKSVVNVRLEAKKEVFDDIEANLKLKNKFNKYAKLKQHHLN